MAARTAAMKAAQAAPAAAPPAGATMLARARALSPRGEIATLPYFGKVWIELAPDTVVDGIESAVYVAMDELKLPPTALNARTYDNRRTALTLAWAVRNPDPAKRDERFGSQEDWTTCDVDLLVSCGLVYNDVRERINPIGMPTLTPELFEEIRLEHEKKNLGMLITYGVALLSSYLASTAAPPATSATQTPSSGPSDPGTSQP